MSATPLGPVVITAREIYDQLIRAIDLISGMNTRLDRLTDGHKATEDDVKDHEVRLRAVERRLWALPSAAVVLAMGALVVAIIQLVRGG